MDIKIKTWLFDIKQSIEEIFLFLGEERDFVAYKADLKTKKAVERNLEIIGEAVHRILKQDNTFQLKNAKNIIGTRNRIIHSYDNISRNTDFHQESYSSNRRMFGLIPFLRQIVQ
jgi:uncharacterized protein with HEPN domain